MNYTFTIILILYALKGQCQEVVYTYSGIDCPESFFIQPNSFVYNYYCGLSFGESSGSVHYSNDTLILNSKIQPSYKLTRSIGPQTGNDSIFIIVKNLNFPNQIGIRLTKGKYDYDLDFQDSNVISVSYDNLQNSTKYAFSSKIIKRKEKLQLIQYRTNLLIHLNNKNEQGNQYHIEFQDLPDLTGYHFFTNKKAVIIKGNLILLDQEDKPEKTWHPIISKRGIIRYSKKRVKIYQKCT